MTDTPSSVRLDVWLWRARFFKSRSLAAAVVDAGRVRLSRAGQETRLDKASRTVKPGDGVVFALNGRLTAVEVLDCGVRRGPAAEARALYASLDEPMDEPVEEAATG